MGKSNIVDESLIDEADTSLKELDEENHLKHFSDFHQFHLDKNQVIIKNHIEDISKIEELLGFQFWLSKEIVNKIKLIKKEELTRIGLVQNLYFRNILYLYAAFEIIQKGLPSPCFNNLRAVHESLLKLFYLFCFPDKTEDIVKDENEKTFRFNHNHLMQSLYSDTKQIEINRTYKILCSPSHSGLEGLIHNVDYSEIQTQKCLKFIQALSFYNILVESEIQSKELPFEDIDGTIRKFFQQMTEKLKNQDGKMEDYFPDKSNLIEKFGFLRNKPPQ